MEPTPPTRAAAGGGEDPVDLLLVQVLERAESEGTPALERACAAHPELAAELARRWSELEGLRVLPHQAAPEVPERLGDFRIVRRLGGGGMGVVYLAVQESLGREVALKLVRPDQSLFAGTPERFLREVHIVARL